MAEAITGTVIDDAEVTNMLTIVSQTRPRYQKIETELRKSLSLTMVGGRMDHVSELMFRPLGLGRGKTEGMVSDRSSPRASLACRSKRRHDEEGWSAVMARTVARTVWRGSIPTCPKLEQGNE